MLETEVLIIGGGATGTGLARDLALRGIHCLVVEKGDINAGASGGNHGLLHSGARYVLSDPAAARECREEGALLKQMAAHCIEDTGGLFTAVEGDDENYIADFPSLCAEAGIPARRMDVKEAREAEPALSEKTIAVYQVEDASIDPFKLSLDNMAHARTLGSSLLLFSRVTAFNIEGNRIQSVMVTDTATGRETRIRAEVVVSAAGAWADLIAAMCGIEIHMVYSKGSLLVTPYRLAQRVINRLRKASDADILVPGGNVSILGTTSLRVDSPDGIYPKVDEVEYIIREGAAMVPTLESTRYIRAYSGVRPLVSSGKTGDDRAVSRGFNLVEHQEDGIENFITITGGKLTTYRLMAEKAADLVCKHLDCTEPCRTGTVPLPDLSEARWTDPASASKTWVRQKDPEDILLCECEMVPKSVVDAIVSSIQEQNQHTRLTTIALRSRVGKGPCQGTFCSLRIAAYLYDRHVFNQDQGLDEIRNFLQERWRGQRPLLWDSLLAQSELQEAMHCGMFGLELEAGERVSE